MTTAHLLARAAGHPSMSRLATLLAAAVFSGTASCQSDPAKPNASSIEGSMGGSALTIPADAVASGVVFVGEDVWRPDKAKAQPLEHQIKSFDVALNRQSLRLVHFDASDPASRLDHGKYIFADVEVDGVPSSDAGIAARHVLFVETMMHRKVRDEKPGTSGLRSVSLVGPESRANRGFNSNHFSPDPVVNITCNRAVQVSPPFADVSTCFEDFALPPFGAGVRVFLEKSDLPRWRAVRDAFASTLDGLASPNRRSR